MAWARASLMAGWAGALHRAKAEATDRWLRVRLAEWESVD